MENITFDMMNTEKYAKELAQWQDAVSDLVARVAKIPIRIAEINPIVYDWQWHMSPGRSFYVLDRGDVKQLFTCVNMRHYSLPEWTPVIQAQFLQHADQFIEAMLEYVSEQFVATADAINCASKTMDKYKAFLSEPKPEVDANDTSHPHCASQPESDADVFCPTCDFPDDEGRKLGCQNPVAFQCQCGRCLREGREDAIYRGRLLGDSRRHRKDGQPAGGM